MSGVNLLVYHLSLKTLLPVKYQISDVNLCAFIYLFIYRFGLVCVV